MDQMNRGLAVVIAALTIAVLIYFWWIAVLAASDQIQDWSGLSTAYSILAAIGGYILMAPAAMILTYSGAVNIWGWSSWQGFLLLIPGLVFFLTLVAGDYPELLADLFGKRHDKAQKKVAQHDVSR
jgi:hypothetical protein